MARPTVAVFLAAALGLALSACSGGTGVTGGSIPSTADSTQTVGDIADALVMRRTGSENARSGIGAAEVLGARLRQMIPLAGDAAWDGAAGATPSTLERCRDGIELFAPDRNGDANSTEALVFYDPGCRRLALDDVRIYTPTGANSETVARSDAFYAPGASAPTAAATTQSTVSNATFGSYGLPLPADGFATSSTTHVTVGRTPILSAGAEFVMMPGTAGSNAFCENSAGFDPTGVVSLGETFGWQGGVASGGSRTVSGNTVTWRATPAGTAYTAAPGALSILSGTTSDACPIASPAYTLAGGTAAGSYALPLTVQFRHGMLWNVSIARAALPGGDTLRVRTVHRAGRGHSLIEGAVSNGGTPIARFAVNLFGMGELTVVSTGAQYRIVDWVVVQ
jgi:hypothetical protein